MHQVIIMGVVIFGLCINLLLPPGLHIETHCYVEYMGYNLLTRTELDTADANATEGHRLHKIKIAEIIDIFQQNSHRIMC